MEGNYTVHYGMANSTGVAASTTNETTAVNATFTQVATAHVVDFVLKGTYTCRCDVGFYGNGSECFSIHTWQRPIAIYTPTFGGGGGGMFPPSG